MKVIPFETKKKYKNNLQELSFFEEYCEIEEQIKIIEDKIDEKKLKLNGLSKWGRNETYLEYQKTIDCLKKDLVYLEKKRMDIITKLMKEKEEV